MVKTVRNNFELPPNPTFKEIPNSDGDSRRWPSNTTKIIDSDGQVNYMYYVPIDEGMAIKWRVSVGEALGNALGWPSKLLISSCLTSSPQLISRGSKLRLEGLACGL